MNIFPTDGYTSHDDVYQQYAQFEKYISLGLSMLVRDKRLADKSQDYMISLENPLLLLELPIVVFEVRDGEYTGEGRAFSTKEKLNKGCQTPIYSLDEGYIMHNDNRRQFRVLLTELKLDPIEFLKKSKQFKDKTKWEKKNDN